MLIRFETFPARECITGTGELILVASSPIISPQQHDSGKGITSARTESFHIYFRRTQAGMPRGWQTEGDQSIDYILIGV